MQIDPAKIWIRFNLAIALLCNGDVEDGLHEYREAVKLCEDKKSIDNALQDLKNALTRRPNLEGAEEAMRILESWRASDEESNLPFEGR